MNDGGTLRHNLEDRRSDARECAHRDWIARSTMPNHTKVHCSFRTYQGNSAASPTEGRASACTTAIDPDADWNLQGGNTNCGAATLM